MTNTLRFVLAAAALSLLVAAALHAGLILPGRFDEAAMYETGVAVVLLVGFGLTFLGPAWARWGGLAASIVALAGASIGLYMAVRGFAPNTALDIVYHVALIALLLVAVVVASRGPVRPIGTSDR